MVQISFNLGGIKRFLGKFIKILFYIVLVGGVGYGAWYGYTRYTNTPMKVRVTNVSGRSATISWITKRADKGIVVFNDRNSFSIFNRNKAYDDRDYAKSLSDLYTKITKKGLKDVQPDESVSISSEDLTNVKVTKKGDYYVHHVTVKDLEPKTEYFFKVGNGLRTWNINGVDNKVTTNEFETVTAFAFTTFDDPSSIPSPDPAYGRLYTMIKNKDGYLVDNPTTDAIIFAKGQKSETSAEYSQIQSSVTNTDGGWTIDKSNFRDSNGNLITNYENGVARLIVTAQFETLTPKEKKSLDWGFEDKPASPIIGNTDSNVRSMASPIAEKIASILNKFANVSYAYDPDAKKTACRCPNGTSLGKMTQGECDSAKAKNCKSSPPGSGGGDGVKDCNCPSGKSLGKRTSADCEKLKRQECGNNDNDNPTTTNNGLPSGADNPGSVVKDCYPGYKLQNGKCVPVRDESTCKTQVGAYGCEVPNCYCKDDKGVNVAMNKDCRPAGCASENRRPNEVVDPSTGQMKAIPCNRKDLCPDGKCPTEHQNGSCTETVVVPPVTNSAIVPPVVSDGSCKTPYPGDFQITSFGIAYVCQYECKEAKWVPEPTGQCEPITNIKRIKCPANAQVNAGRYVEKASDCCVTGYACDVSGNLLKGKCAQWYRYIYEDGMYQCVPDQAGERSPSCTDPNKPIVMIGSDGTRTCVSEYAFQNKNTCCYTSGSGSASWISNYSCKQRGGHSVHSSYCGFDPDGTQYSGFHTVCCEDKKTGKRHISGSAGCSLENDVYVGDSDDAKGKKCDEENVCCKTKRGTYSWTSNKNCDGSITSGVNSEAACDSTSAANSTTKGKYNDNKLVCSTSYGFKKAAKYGSLSEEDKKDVQPVNSADDCGYCCLYNSRFSWQNTKCTGSNIPVNKNSKGSCESATLGVSTENTNVLGTSDIKNNQYIKYYIEPGVYSLTINDKKYVLSVSTDNPTAFYIERNGLAGYQEAVNIASPKVDEDALVQFTSKDIKIEKLSSGYKLKLDRGMNIVSFPVMLTQDGETPFTAMDLMNAANINGPVVTHISYFESGAWNPGVYLETSDKKTLAGNDFPLTFGKGYLIKSDFNFEMTIPSFAIKTPIPVAFSAGWNLVGIHGYAQTYTASSLIKSINGIEGLTADNVTWWPTYKGKYEGLQVSEGAEYGFDFPIAKDLGYFVRISKFSPADATTKSLIWNPGGELHGKPGTAIK